MNIQYGPNKICKNDKFLCLGNGEKVVLIGGNGSGKSSILETIFEDFLEKEEKIIVFSSGQNEKFSNIFEKYKKSSRKYNNIFMNNENKKNFVDSFYFDKTWVRLLIFIAIACYKNGNTYSYLKEKGYISDNSDIYLDFSFKLGKKYVDKILWEQKQEEKGEILNQNLFRKTNYHFVLESLIQEKYDRNFEFDDSPYPLKKRKIRFSVNEFHDFMKSTLKFYKYGFSLPVKFPAKGGYYEIEKIFDFFARATNGSDQNIDLSTMSLFFVNNLEFKMLSDGEYQLLALYSIFDIFDSTEVLFLFDEIDSHLHFKNLNNLWEKIKEIDGRAIITSHQSESILKNDLNNICFIEGGEIKKYGKLKELKEKFSDIVSRERFEFDIVSNMEYVVLMDDELDWEIFKKLVRKKLGDQAYDNLKHIFCIKCSSSYNDDTEIFGKGKLEYIRKFSEYIEGNKDKAQKFFLICDRDNLPETNIGQDFKVKLSKENHYKTILDKNNVYLLSWKRREIENYLLYKDIIRGKEGFEHLNLDNLDLDKITDIKNCDPKKITKSLYKEPEYNEKKLDEIIEKMPIDEISSDIKTMYDFLISKIK